MRRDRPGGLTPARGAARCALPPAGRFVQRRRTAVDATASRLRERRDGSRVARRVERASRECRRIRLLSLVQQTVRRRAVVDHDFVGTQCAVSLDRSPRRGHRAQPDARGPSRRRRSDSDARLALGPATGGIGAGTSRTAGPAGRRGASSAERLPRERTAGPAGRRGASSAERLPRERDLLLKVAT